MLDVRRIRQNPDELRAMLKSRNKDASVVDDFLAKDEQRRALMAQAEEKKALRNQTSKEIGLAKKNGADEAQTAAIMDAMRALGEEIAALDTQIAALDEAQSLFLLTVPNYPHASVPLGEDERQNVEQRRWGDPRKFAWEPKPHWDIGTDL